MILEIGVRSHTSALAIFCAAMTLMLCVFLFDNYAMKSERVRRPGALPFILRKWRIWTRPGALVCPYCRDLLCQEDAETCAGCNTSYHSACRAELLGGCGTLGCEHQGGRISAPNVVKKPPLQE